MVPAYSPDTGLFYVNAFDGEQKFFMRDENYEEGEQFTGGGGENVKPNEAYFSAIRALDPKTGISVGNSRFSHAPPQGS